MKYVQVGILACLLVIAGLLIGIYRGGQSPTAERVDAEGVSLEEGRQGKTPATPAGPVPQEAAVVAEPKPSPLSPAPAQRRPKTTPRPKPPAPSSEPAAPEQVAAVEPEFVPQPVIEPVIPNLPPLVEMPAPEPAPEPQLVTVPEGTEIVVRLINTLSTNRNLPGDKFEATLEEPLAVSGWLVAPKGSPVEGRVLESKKAGRVKGVAELSFDLVRLTTADGKTVDITTAPFGQVAEKSRGDDMKKIGWGAGIGAIIGAIAGGGKGAAIGAGAGAGAGAGTVLATRGETVVVPTETRLSFRLSEPLQVTSTQQANL